MISSAELSDWIEEVGESDTSCQRLKEIAGCAIDECHRLKNLINELVIFRQSKEHDAMMAELKAMREDLEKNDDLSS